jgi:hypothetical protein
MQTWRTISKFGMATVFLISVFGGFGCSGHSPVSKAVQVTITNKPTSVTAGTTMTFTATVTNDKADEGVTWTITPASGAGTISSNTTTSVTYTAPATPPAANSVTVTATSVADTTKSDSATFTIAAKTPPAISVSITNKISTITAGAAAVTLSASVTNDSANAGVSWTLSAGGASCSPTCGTLSAVAATSVVYTPPATAPAAPNNAPVITATSVSDATKSDTDTITIQAAAQTGIVVTITNKFATIAAGAPTATVNVTVTNDPKNDGVNWTLTAGGSACSPECGTLTLNDQFTVMYTSPTTAPAAPNNAPTITATSATDSTKSDAFTFTINPPAASLGLLKGQYAALLQGGDSKQNPRAMAISFTADGSGRITEASVDLNEDFQIFDVQGPVQGTYSVDTSLDGSVRGTISIPSFTFPNYPNSPTNPALGFVFVLASDGKSGNIEERDTGLSVVSGKLYQQDATASSVTSLEGDYAFGVAAAFNGNVAAESNWEAMVGRFTINDSLAFQNGLTDMSVSQTGPTMTDVQLAGGVTQPDTTGRTVMNLIPIGGTMTTYACYIVNASTMVFVEVDPTSAGVTSILGGTATRQKTPFATSPLNGASVFWANGQENVNVMGSSAAAGRFVFSNSTAADVEYDRSYNVSGKPANNTGSALPVVLDTGTGRGTIEFANGASNLLFDSAVVYLTDSNAGYLLDTTATTKAEALFGTFVPQAAGPFDSTYLSGNVLALEGGYESRDAAQFFGVFTVTSPSGAYNFFDYYQDASGNVQTGTDNSDPNNVLSGIDATSGRGTGKFDPSGNQCSNDAVCGSAFYLIGKNQAVMVNQPAASPATQADSSVNFLDPQ